MLRVLIPCLLVSSVLAASEEQCQVGDVTFTGFDLNEYVGTWYELYRTQNAGEEDYANCEYDDYFVEENGIGVRSVAYNIRTRSFETSVGTVPLWTDTTFYISYSKDELWTSQYWVVGTDYKTYSILRGCLANDSTHPLTWVASRTTSFDDETKQEVNSILEQYGLSLDDLQPVSQGACAEYESS
ncbi:crustacyanin-A2 subunit-like [Zootermopsis nevadensis]|uniref:Lopap n=1 Tax=Zootermopsis nevadensis TaxID=136037 RepID=A0A067QTU6_ZOONE|nr:crustacyanin-A2 subunit-like [Zootermopsis nevadensis]XP_021938525.1 crustacyanin-A2 subunit-like [Zootermopsis nevadensis]KDR09043.1 Lopap [Zootermopsis nevadensis]